MYSKFLFIVFLSCCITFSCSEDDFLDKKPIASLVVGGFPATEDELTLAVNGVYNTLREWHINEGGFPIIGILSHDITKGSNPGDQPALNDYSNFKHNASEGSMSRWWSTLYLGIRRANLVIANVDNISGNEKNITQRIAEARFFRGYFYSVLVRAFGDVPKVIDVDPAIDLTRTDKNEIFNDIIFPDLLFAANNLPKKSEYEVEDNGRVSKGTAKSLMVRLYLFIKDFKNAEKYALEVINSGEYALEDDFSNAFSVTNEYGIENVFEVGALPIENIEQGGNQFANTWNIRGTPNRGWGFGRPSYELIQAWDKTDPRYDKSIIFLGEELAGEVTVGDGNTPDTTYDDKGNIIEIESYNQKVWVPGSTTREPMGYNKRIIRYADVLLMAAEALNENGNSSEALKYLNQVRKRARDGNQNILPDITTTNQNELRIAIYKERRFELAMEGLRFWDLVRTGRAKEILGKYGFIEGVHELLPIPQIEVDISNGRITQNKGY